MDEWDDIDTLWHLEVLLDELVLHHRRWIPQYTAETIERALPVLNKIRAAKVKRIGDRRRVRARTRSQNRQPASSAD